MKRNSILFACGTMIITVILGGALAACSSEAQKTATNSTTTTAIPTPAITPQAHITPPPSVATNENASTAEVKDAPVEFTYNGITADKESFSYKVKVKTTKPVSQVDIAIKYLDAEGRVLSETTRAWQNIVKSKKQPIEQGKTYDVTDELEPGSTRVECQLKRVFFTDGSSWSAK